jgi:hypothetical protein
MSKDFSYAIGAFAVTPSDETVFATPVRAKALYIGGTGNVAVTLVDDTSVVFSAVPVGSILPVNVKKVLATGTTATLILCLY